jgi:hypothetical protein
MNSAIAAWLFFRAMRWLAWFGLLAYSIHFLNNRQYHVTSLGHLQPMTEAALFGFGVISVFAGFFELMMRERAGLARPKPLRLMAPKAEPEH